jgi:hypothetical protein
MQLIPTPGRVATASANVVRMLTGRRARPSAGAGWTGDHGVGVNPVRRYSSASSRTLAGRGPGSRGRSDT